MIGALVYLQVQSVRNRLRVRIGRLKKPKYLVGALVGAAYFYFFFLRNLFASSRAPAAVNPSSSPETLALTELLGALVLLAMAGVAWIFPRERAALVFTEAEIAFLFPAPVTRKTLIHFKLLRSQAASSASSTATASRAGRAPASRRCAWSPRPTTASAPRAPLPVAPRSSGAFRPRSRCAGARSRSPRRASW